MPTAAEITTRLAAYKAAELKVLEGQEYTISDGVVQRRLRRADLEQIRTVITQLEGELTAQQAREGGTRRLYNIVPRY